MLINLNKAFFETSDKKQVIWIASGKYSSFFQILSSAWEVLNQFLYFSGCMCYFV
jgi:capsid portal protein